MKRLENQLVRVGDGILCAVAIMINGGKILVGHRHYTKDKWKDISVWTIPGGRSDVGEIIEQTLRREVAEEVGINEFEIIDFIGEVPGAKEGDAVLIFHCETSAEAKLMEPEKFSEWKWLAIDEYINEKQYSGFNPVAKQQIVKYLAELTVKN
jgi:8-oxo-dGTP pyrophosphatase MutT (NUDIX family)